MHRRLTVEECLNLGGHCWPHTRGPAPARQVTEFCRHCSAARTITTDIRVREERNR